MKPFHVINVYLVYITIIYNILILFLNVALNV